MYPPSFLPGSGSLSLPVPSQNGSIDPAPLTSLEHALNDLKEVSGITAALVAPNSDAQWLDPKTTDPIKHFTSQLYDAVKQTPARRDIVITLLQALNEVLETQAQSASDMDEDAVAKQIDLVKLHVDGTLMHLRNNFT